MNCHEARTRIDQLREAGGHRPPELEHHLGGCPDCREAFEAERFLIDAFDDVPWPATPSSLDLPGIEARVERLRAKPEPPSRPSAPCFDTRQAGRLGLPVLALAFVGLLWQSLAGLDQPAGPAPLLLLAYFATGLPLWVLLGARQQRLTRAKIRPSAWHELSLGSARLAVAAALLIGAANPEIQSLLRAPFGRLTLSPAQADGSFFEAAVLCARTSDGQLRLVGASAPCRSDELLLRDGAAALAGGSSAAAPGEYRAGSATIPADLHYVYITFSRPMPHAGYQVTVTASQRGHETRGIARTTACRYLNVSSKSSSGFGIDLRNCADPGAEPLAIDLTLDWIAIETR